MNQHVIKSRLAFLPFVLILAGCGHSSTSSSNSSNQSQQNTVMQAGQWELDFSPQGGNSNPFAIEANLTTSGGTVSSAVFNTGLYEQGNRGPCDNLVFSGTVSGDLLSGTLTQNGGGGGGALPVTLSNGTIASNGQTVSNGTSNVPTYTCAGQCSNSCNPPSGAGTFTGAAVSPLNGTFVGTLSGNGRTDQINVTISQDAGFGITLDGTDNCSPPSSSPFPCPAASMTLHVSPAGPNAYSNVIGRLLEVSGVATYSSGSQNFGLFGYFDQAASTIVVYPCCSSGVFLQESGTLNKQ
jgi:hypothetical protein